MNFFQRFVRRPQQLWVRQFNFQLHLWAGIVLAVYLVVIGVTGSILVFQTELETLSGLKPWHGLQAKEPFADIATVVANIHAAYPRFHIVSVATPNQTDPTFVAILEGRGRLTVASNASDGKVLGEFPRRATWIDVVRGLHESLLAHRTGRILNGVGAAFLLLLSITGLVVWWPGIRSWKRALRVDFRRGWRRINYDLHSAAGFWTLLIVSLWALSGIYFAWPRQVFLFVNSLSPIVSARPPAISVAPEVGAPEPDLDGLVQRAQAIDPGTKLGEIAFPYGRRAPLGILMRRGNGVGREYEDTVFFNPYTGEYLTTWRYGVNQTVGDWIIWLQVPLHFGTYWGLGVKLVWAIAGLAIPILTVSGLLMYWNRALRRKWKRMRKHGAGTEAAAAPTRRSALETAGSTLLAGVLLRRTLAAASRTYIVGSTATGVPFSFIDVKTNTLTGAMVDIVKAVSADAGFPIDLRVSAFAALIPSLTSRKIDIISAAILKTPAREKVVDFSESVYSYGGGLIVAARDPKEYRKIEDLRGMTVGVQVGTRFFDQLQASGAKEIKTYDNLMEMLGDLSVGRIGAAYGDAPIFAYQITQAKMRGARFVKPFTPPSLENVCLVVRKGDSELLGRINASVRRLRPTAIQAILDHWGLRETP